MPHEELSDAEQYATDICQPISCRRVVCFEKYLGPTYVSILLIAKRILDRIHTKT